MAVVHAPERVHVLVDRHRRTVPGACTHWASDLTTDERRSGVTAPVRTVLDCARTLPFGEAVAVADSALRLGLVHMTELHSRVRSLRGAGRLRIERVVAAADGRSGSALESVLRCLLLEADVRTFEPQVVIADSAVRYRVDLADPSQRIVIEADSFAHHGHRMALVADCERYDELAVRGWLVLRFSWEHVVGRPEWVVGIVRAALATSHGPRELHSRGQKSVRHGRTMPN